MDSKQGLPIVPFSSHEDWTAWLEEHHVTSEGLWLKLAKKGAGVDSVTYAEALEIALCYGWIDSQKAGFDERFFLQRFTPRRARSKWSKINRAKATELIERGGMQPAGLREVELAKADGRWEAAYASQSKATVPDDLQRELDANPAAKAFFADLDSANRYAILYRIEEAKRPETRWRRIEKYIGMLERGETIH
ncbi:YdeI family protein [soil metagenome]